MINRLATHLLLRPEDVPPSQPDWEVIGAFNPGAIRVGNEVVLLVRIAERSCEDRAGWTVKEGFVHNVVFPMVVVEAGEQLLVYCGASDRYTAVAAISRSALLAELKPSSGGT